MKTERECAMALVEYFNARRTSLIIEVNKIKRSENRELLMPLKTIDRLNLVKDIKNAIILLIDTYAKVTEQDIFLAVFLHLDIKTLKLKEPVDIRTKDGVFSVTNVSFDREGFITLGTELEEPNDFIAVEDDLGVKEFIKIYEALANTIED